MKGSEGPDRREFLQRAGLGLAGLAVAGCRGIDEAAARRGAGDGGDAGSPDAPGTLTSIGVQLYTVRTALAADFQGTLERVADIGYDEVEFAGYHGRSPARVRNVVQGLGLRPTSAHVPLPAARSEADAVIDTAGEIGHRQLVVAWIAPDRRETLDDWRRLAGEMTEFGGRCAEAGIGFAYHNHAFEFQEREGRRPYDVLMEAADPELVKLQIDFFWVRAGGADPFALFEKAPGRFTSCHVKDMSADGDMVDVGQGVMDFASILGRGGQAGLRHYFVEHDQPDDPLESVARSYRHLAGLTF